MTTSNAIKYSLLFPAVYFALGIVVTFEKRFEPDFLQTVLFIIIGSAVLWIFGLFFSVLISAIFKSPGKESYFYFAGQSLVLLCCMGLVSFEIYRDHQHEKKYGNIEHNRSFLFLNRDGEVDEHTNPLYVKIGFNRLEAEFQNNNDFRLTDFFSFRRDSTNVTYTDTLHILFFKYRTKDKMELFSKIHVFEGKAEMKIFNADPLTSEEYRLASIEDKKEDELVEQQASEMLKELQEALKRDSNKRQ